MAAYFFESSALVKRFAKETGTAFVLGLLRPSAQHLCVLSRLTEIEACAALARRQKALRLTPAQFQKARRRLRREFADHFVVILPGEPVMLSALRLAEQHALRGYDAVQLASALIANDELLLDGLPPLILVSADHDLNQAAQAEGLAVENPNNYP